MAVLIRESLNNITNIQSSDIKMMANISNKNFNILKDSFETLLDDIGFNQTDNKIKIDNAEIGNILIGQSMQLLTNNKSVFSVDSSGHLNSIYSHAEDISESLRFRWYRYEVNKGGMPTVGTDGEMIYYYGELWLFVKDQGWMRLNMAQGIPNPTDAKWGGSVIDIITDPNQITPPLTKDDRYIIGSSATGVFAGHEHQIAKWNGGSWEFTDVAPGTGIIVENKGNSIYYFQDGTAGWVQSGYFYEHEYDTPYTIKYLKQYSVTGGENVIISSEKI